MQRTSNEAALYIDGCHRLGALQVHNTLVDWTEAFAFSKSEAGGEGPGCSYIAVAVPLPSSGV